MRTMSPIAYMLPHYPQPISPLTRWLKICKSMHHRPPSPRSFCRTLSTMLSTSLAFHSTSNLIHVIRVRLAANISQSHVWATISRNPLLSSFPPEASIVWFGAGRVKGRFRFRAFSSSSSITVLAPNDRFVRVRTSFGKNGTPCFWNDPAVTTLVLSFCFGWGASLSPRYHPFHLWAKVVLRAFLKAEVWTVNGNGRKDL